MPLIDAIVRRTWHPKAPKGSSTCAAKSSTVYDRADSGSGMSPTDKSCDGADSRPSTRASSGGGLSRGNTKASSRGDSPSGSPGSAPCGRLPDFSLPGVALAAAEHSPVIRCVGKVKHNVVSAQSKQVQPMAISDFDIVTTLGNGFMGSVRLVKLKDGHDPTPFALKVMPKIVVVKKKQVVHTRQEKELLGQMNHPFIVKLFRSFQDDANLYLLMEFVNGGELFSVLQGGKRFENDGAKFYAAEITLALGHIHGMTVAYRDNWRTSSSTPAATRSWSTSDSPRSSATVRSRCAGPQTIWRQRSFRGRATT
ncbi:unnamed protein product [Prorocentrum cordatum]|uniref:Protein kinase domain-containing protein n=1 Tax=Prorocentrum cordatum TaxID=2364126 RepID=A0ABN9TKT1_9DINO|nr:unnamed protein product [Polarella glacialis]